MDVAETSGDHAASGPDRRRALLESIALAGASALIAGAAVLGLWLTVSASIRDNYAQYVEGVARIGATMVDPVLHDAIRDPAQLNGPLYKRAVEPLRRLRKAMPDVRFIYTLVRDGDRVRYVLDASDPGARGANGVLDQSGVGDLMDDPSSNDALWRALDSGSGPGRAGANMNTTTDQWGSFVSGFSPMVDAHGRQFGILGVDIRSNLYLHHLAVVRERALFGLVPGVLLMLLVATWYYHLRLKMLSTARRELQIRREAQESREQRMEIKQALVESEANFRSLFERSPVGIALSDLQTRRFLQVNDTMTELTGYSREELLQRSFDDITPSDWHVVDDEHQSLLARDSSPGGFEKEYLCKDGTRRPVFITDNRIRDSSGRELVWALVQDISQRKAMERELRSAALRDRLTGLANRTRFIEALQAAVRRTRAGQQQGYAVLFLDFDRFKLVNDSLGHAAGDVLLQQIARRLTESLHDIEPRLGAPGESLVARFGGDEFLVLLNDVGTPQIGRIADQLLLRLAGNYSIHGHEVFSTASIGIVTSGQSAEDAEAVIRNADVAMYEAKRSGRACAVMFSEEMRTQLTRHVTIESGLRTALGTSQLAVVYQPIIELASGRLVSVETLCRWRHPQLGDVSPAEFIPVAEESGLIIPLGEWVLQESCERLAQWRQQDPMRAPRTVSVNVSRVELALGERLLERVQTVLERTGLPPGCLQLEVTEREVMRDPRGTLLLMRRLHEMGVRLAMDDFGTGTSSLGCLREYPFDVIKIDRSFVQDLVANPDVLAVIHATITLVENLGRTSVAEGVEQGDQVAVLQSLGCHYGQGYFFSRPLTEQQMHEYMFLPAAVGI